MFEGIIDTIGATPLMRLKRLFSGRSFETYAKLEFFNPSGSIKDRAARNLVERAIINGHLQPGATVVESSSGNLGIGLAQVCLYYGFRFICVVDGKTTPQNLAILRSYGAEIELVSEPCAKTGEFLPARIERVHEICRATPGSYWPNQYSNIDNARAHFTTAHEIVEQLGRAPDYLLCATGSCGTIRGCAEFLMENRHCTKIIAVDAVGSAIFGDVPRKRLIPGHGSAIVPDLLDRSLISRHVHVDDAACVRGCRRALRQEAMLLGGSSGAVISALDAIADDIREGAHVVLILSDRGDRYLDTIYSDEWVSHKLGIRQHAAIHH